MYKQSTIALVAFPFTDLSGSKVRPALIISKAPIGDDVIVVFISSNTKKKNKFDVLVKKNTLNGLKSDSLIRVSKIATLEKKILLGEIGKLGEEDTLQVQNQLKSLLLQNLK